MTYLSSWRSPSNIALIKYWGKHGLQLPRNPSLSFTLSACHTSMSLEASPAASSPGLVVLYDGQPRPSFEPKIRLFFSLVHDYFPWLSDSAILIDSHNTFPHGAGIASSASAMSALVLCLMDIDGQINGSSFAPNKEWWQKASTLARLGSGSASRSVYAGAALWGRMADVNASNDLFAIPWETEISSIYKTYQDTILIISASEKSVSSTAGHKLMDGLPYADMRYAEARRHMLTLMEAMRHDHSLDLFISVVESEALQLHALMMSGDSPFLLMEAGTISVIKEVWRYRKETGIPVCFTLDAGPNVHLLYPLEYKDTVLDWIIRHLVQFCKDGMYIADHTGSGPEKIS